MRKQMTRIIEYHRDNIIFTVIELIFGLILPFVIAYIFSKKNPIVLGIYAFGLSIISFLIIIVYNQRRLLDKKIDPLYQILNTRFSHRSFDDQYLIRSEHYSIEKFLLAELLAKQVLPKCIETLHRNNNNLSKVNIIIDSGSTLAPLFSEIIADGIDVDGIIYDSEFIRYKNSEIWLYTNSQAGIDEIHKMPSSKYYKLTERHFNLISGQPLKKYRATTGKYTQEFLELLWSEKAQKANSVKTIGIITANWFILGKNCNKLELCARGSGHMDFKESVIEHSDVVIVVSPLGKLLPISDVRILNTLIAKYDNDSYKTHCIEDKYKDKTFLLTTLRPDNSNCELSGISDALKNDIKLDNAGTNYTIHEFCQEYHPKGKSKEEVSMIDMPHSYLRDNKKAIYRHYLK